LADIIHGEFYHIFEGLIIFDCRFPYEFAAGHISGAHNLRTLEYMRDIYDHFLGKRMCVVFHCEFSQARGPAWSKMFREFDRRRNIKDNRGCNNVHYPDVFVLNGGYQACFNECRSITIGGYRPMTALEPEERELLGKADQKFKLQTRKAANYAFLSAFADPQRREPLPPMPSHGFSLSQPSLRKIAPPNFGLKLSLA
jgi:hypothetical protein